MRRRSGSVGDLGGQPPRSTRPRGDPPSGVRAQRAGAVLMDVVHGCLGNALHDQGKGRRAGHVSENRLRVYSIGTVVLPFLLSRRYQLGCSSAAVHRHLSSGSLRFLSGFPAERPALCRLSSVALDGDRNRRGAAVGCRDLPIGIVVPVSGGLFVWRYATAHFDRLVGRPWREIRSKLSTWRRSWHRLDCPDVARTASLDPRWQAVPGRHCPPAVKPLSCR